MKRIKSMLINKLHRVCYESKDSPTADSFADDMKNFTEAFGHLDIHDNMIELALIWTGDGRVDDLDLAALVLNKERFPLTLILSILIQNIGLKLLEQYRFFLKKQISIVFLLLIKRVL